MAWEKRKSRGRYYYRTKRVGRRFRKIYLGAGDIAETLAAIDVQARYERKQISQEWQQFAQRWEDALGVADTLANATDALLRLTLLTHGYRQHARGFWRKRRACQEI